MRYATPRAGLLVLALLVTLTGWGCQKRQAEQPKAPPQAEAPLVPSDASRSENYTLVPLKQDLQVAPATDTTESTTTTSSTN
jgi:hypothetical protein